MKNKLEKYVLTAGAVVFGANIVNAQIIYTDIDPSEIINGANPSFDINMLGEIKYQLNLQSNSSSRSMGLKFQTGTAQAYMTASYLKALSMGAPIENITQWEATASAWNIGWYYSSLAYGNFIGTSGKYIGLKFNNGADTHYGWIQIDADGSSMTLSGYGYNDTADGPITAGQIPEPTGLGLLALGAAGLLASRKRSA